MRTVLFAVALALAACTGGAKVTVVESKERKAGLPDAGDLGFLGLEEDASAEAN